MVWLGRLVGFNRGEILLGFAERVDEIRDKIFGGGFLFEGFFFVFDDNFIIGDFGDFLARDGEFGIYETFNGGALDDDLLGNEIF